MIRIPHHLWTFCLAIGICSMMSVAACAEGPASAWDGFRRLKINLAASEAEPFLEIRVPEDAAKHASTFLADDAKQLPKTGNSDESVSTLALPADRAQQVQTQRAKLRESLAQQGLSSAEGRDDLATEVFSVAKWTIVTLVTGTVVVIGIKQFKLRTVPPVSAQGIRLLESFSLGRQQGLNLVEVGGERFLVASDQSGIKSVTLLPSWPRMDDADEESRLQIFDGAEIPVSSSNQTAA